MVIRDIRKPPPGVPVIVSEDGTWHRPLTTLELAILQSLSPRMPDGSPLKFIGGNQSVWREWIGNMVPPSAGKAIGDTMLVALVEAD
jgi:site-specific DNA-cytosine methylase